MAQDNNDKVKFDDYKWEQDEEWQILIKKLEFPPTFDENKKEKHILKRKHKYFRQKIDPNFKPTSSAPKASKPKISSTPPPVPSEPTNEPNPHDPSNNTSSSSSTTSSSSDADLDPDPEPVPEPKPKPTQSSTGSSNRNYNNNYGRYQSYQPPPTAIGKILGPILPFFSLVSQWFIFTCCILSLVIPSYYYYALYGVIVMHLISTIYNNGAPSMNMWYAQRVMQDENIMITIYGAIFLMGNPVFIFLCPIVLRSFYMGIYLFNGFLSAKLPSLKLKFQPLFSRVLYNTGWYNQTIAILEVLVGIFLIFACFFMSRTVILTFIYWQIMHARYMMSRMIQYAFSVIHGKIKSVLSKIPFLLNIYEKLSNMLWNMVDPAKIQSQMQGGGTGGIAGMLRKCEIM